MRGCLISSSPYQGEVRWGYDTSSKSPPLQRGIKGDLVFLRLTIISKCHPEPFRVAQDKLREGSKIPEKMVLTPLAMVYLLC